MNEHEVQTVSVLSKYGFRAPEVMELFRYARSLARLAEARCNRELSEREEKRDDTLERHVAELVAVRNEREGGKPVVVEVQGDPRGYVVKLKLPGNEYNNWGGESWGIG